MEKYLSALRNLGLKMRRRLSQVDAIVRIAIDKVLPRNLTARYIMALSAVATLTIIGQIVIQRSLATQSEDQRKLRFMERQIHDSEMLRKASVALQLTSRKGELKNQLENVRAISVQLAKDEFIEGELEQPSALIAVRKTVDDSLVRVLESCRILRELLTDAVNSGASKVDYRMGGVIKGLLEQGELHRTGLRDIASFYEQRLEHQITKFKRTELLLLLVTLLVLVLEALYVFRPGVEHLYEALRTRSEFLGRMGHEMRNPMNSIMGMSNLLLETPLSQQQKKYVSILRKSSVGLLDLLNNLLDFSSIESGKIKLESISFNLYELLEKSIDLAVFGAQANGIELILDLGTNVPLKLKGDPVRLQQVLANLLGNAVKFTKKGEVVLKVELLKDADPSLIQFSVIDTGIGIEKKKTQNIFDAFVQEDTTVRRRFGGTGLGLSISRDLVELLGGSLEVESEKNLGSRFYFALPFEVVDDVSIEQTIVAQNLGSYEAIVIEPKDRIAELLAEIIRKSGGTPKRLAEVKDLELSSVGSNGGERQVVIIDYEFAKSTFNSLLPKAQRKELRTDHLIFLINTTASATDLEWLAENGVQNFLFKPVKPLQLIESIEQLWTGNKGVQRQKLIHDSRVLRVLAADDSADNQFLIRVYLESLPYRLSFVENGQQAMERFKNARFDVVLMDLQMPEMDGYTATQQIRKWEAAEGLPPTPIIAVSAHSQAYETERFKSARFSGHLVKPISANELRSAIMKLTSHVKSPEKSRNTVEEIEKQLLSMAPKYLANRWEELRELKQWIETSDFKKIGTFGHRIRGNAKTYGFEDLGLIGMRLEEAANDQNLKLIRELTAETESYLTKARSRQSLV